MNQFHCGQPHCFKFLVKCSLKQFHANSSSDDSVPLWNYFKGLNISIRNCCILQGVFLYHSNLFTLPYHSRIFHFYCRITFRIVSLVVSRHSILYPLEDFLLGVKNHLCCQEAFYLHSVSLSCYHCPYDVTAKDTSLRQITNLENYRQMCNVSGTQR